MLTLHHLDYNITPQGRVPVVQQAEQNQLSQVVTSQLMLLEKNPVLLYIFIVVAKNVS